MLRLFFFFFFCKSSSRSERCQALSGTLKTARKTGVVEYAREIEVLFQGVHDGVAVTLLKDSIPDSNETTCACAADTQELQRVCACLSPFPMTVIC
jgi:hypothetical protein